MPSEDLHPWAFNLCPFFVWSGRLSFQSRLCQPLTIHLPRHICPIWTGVGPGTYRSGFSDGAYRPCHQAWAIGQTLKPEQMLWLIINWIIKDVQLVFRLDHMVCMNYLNHNGGLRSMMTSSIDCNRWWTVSVFKHENVVNDLQGAFQKPLNECKDVGPTYTTPHVLEHHANI